MQLARELLHPFGMPDRDGPKSSNGLLPVQVIDDLGRVVDTIYVGDITSNSLPLISRNHRADRRRITREH